MNIMACDIKIKKKWYSEKRDLKFKRTASSQLGHWEHSFCAVICLNSVTFLISIVNKYVSNNSQFISGTFQPSKHSISVAYSNKLFWLFVGKLLLWKQ